MTLREKANQILLLCLGFIGLAVFVYSCDDRHVSHHTHDAYDIISGKLDNTRLCMGDGGGIDADSVDGLHAVDLADADTVDGQHASAFAPASHSHDATDIVSGTISNNRLNTGTGSNQIIELDSAGRLPAVDGSQLTNLPSAAVQCPIGCVMAWCKSITGVPSLPSHFMECNGQLVTDTGSPLYNHNLPDLNGFKSGANKRFLRGGGSSDGVTSPSSGSVGGSDTHMHTLPVGPWFLSGASFPANPGVPTQSNASSSLPSYYEIVWVIRVR
jgi:hypothetical protein